MNMTKDFTKLTFCNMCGEDDFYTIFSTENMPLTGLYVPKDIQADIPVYDQEFLSCNHCRHGQLRNIINPEILYDDTYTHRSSESAISIAGNDFFYEYLLDQTKDRKSKSLLEVGCNDLVLIKQIQELSDEINGVDPIWIDKDFEYNEKTKIKGAFVNELSKHQDFLNPPDLIVSAHTFEHISDTYEHFKMLCDISADNCRFVIELPSFDSMVKIGRFDQVFHQHLQYISLTSMIAMINRLGCKYVGHKFNYDYWGGTILFTFDKEIPGGSIDNPTFIPMENNKIMKRFLEFEGSLLNAKEFCENSDEDVYGFGAAQMLPIIAHHMKSDMSFLKGIIDDNSDRVGTFLPGVEAPIVSSESVENIQDSVVMITALDSTRPILRRLLDISPRRILNPLQLF